eukprot:2330545-Prymnesium_polylepis.2
MTAHASSADTPALSRSVCKAGSTSRLRETASPSLVSKSSRVRSCSLTPSMMSTLVVSSKSFAVIPMTVTIPIARPSSSEQLEHSLETRDSACFRTLSSGVDACA